MNALVTHPSKQRLIPIAGMMLVAWTAGDLPAQHADIAVFRNAMNRISTHDSSSSSQPLEDVFTRAFDFFGHPFGNPGLPKVFNGDDPGLQMNGNNPPAGYVALPGMTPLRANLLSFRIPGSTASNLYYWDAQGGSVLFGNRPAGHTLIVKDRLNVSFVLDGSAQVHSNVALGSTDSQGGMHEHINFRLDDNDNNVETDPQRGFYLFGLELEMAGLTKSEPIFVALSSPEVPLSVELQVLDWLRTHRDQFVIGDGLPGDFDQDGVYRCNDVDALVSQIVGATHPATFDLTGDGLVNRLDLDTWRAVAGAVLNVSGNPIQEGDANLDGVVDGSDFGLWNGNKFTAQAAWCAGDFNADGVIDGSDFGIWNGNKFQTADRAMVPEPALAGFLWLVWCLAARRRTQGGDWLLR